ncbi:MAG: PQQ-binding-like beta-propeller repeat protein [Sphingomonadales bacterium]|nr:PQQ-binding-like beta-propeller repeat protein [Sphingomonadales bacterium]
MARRLRDLALHAGAILGVAALASVPSAFARTTSGYRLLRSVALPQVTGWDYLATDAERHRLFITDNSGVLEFDTAAMRLVGPIPPHMRVRGVGMVHGVAIAPALGRGYISVEQPSSITAFDRRTRARLWSADVDPGADAVVFEPRTRTVLSFNGKTAAVDDVGIVDAVTGANRGAIALPGRPEAAVADDDGNVFVNIADRSEIGVIDANAHKVTALWPIGNCPEPSAMAIDKRRHLLFSACDNKSVVMVDARSGRVVSRAASGDGTDAMAFDPAKDLLFVASADGTLTIARESDGRTLGVIDTIRTGANGRTLALDALTHHVFILTARFAASGKPTKDNPHGYPRAIPGSVRLLVFGQS